MDIAPTGTSAPDGTGAHVATAEVYQGRLSGAGLDESGGDAATSGASSFARVSAGATTGAGMSDQGGGGLPPTLSTCRTEYAPPSWLAE
jgi:hypothetical protein